MANLHLTASRANYKMYFGKLVINIERWHKNGVLMGFAKER